MSKSCSCAITAAVATALLRLQRRYGQPKLLFAPNRREAKLAFRTLTIAATGAFAATESIH